MDTQRVLLIQKAVSTAMQRIADEHGLILSDQQTVTHEDHLLVGAKMTQAAADVDGAPAVFASMAPLVGLKASDYGRKFIFRSSVYTIIGVHPERRRYPISANRSDGKGFKFTAELVKNAIAKQSA